MFISVIVPTFNSETFLPVLLKDLNQQTFEDYEVILVDDGSEDKTREICSSFCKNNPRFRFFTKKNGGAGSARNYGLDKASGDFIVFVDSDDRISDAFLQRLYSAQCESSADLIVAPYDAPYMKNGGQKKALKSFVQGRDQVIDSFFRDEIGVGPCSKLYKKCLLADLRYDTSLVINEDKLFLFKYLLKCESLYILDEPLYTCVYREESVSHSTDFGKRAQDMFFVYKAISGEWSSQYAPHFKEHSLRTLLYVYKTNCRYTSFKLGDYLFESIHSEIRKISALKGRISFRLKAERIAYLHFEPLYRQLLKAYYQRKHSFH